MATSMPVRNRTGGFASDDEAVPDTDPSDGESFSFSILLSPEIISNSEVSEVSESLGTDFAVLCSMLVILIPSFFEVCCAATV